MRTNRVHLLLRIPSADPACQTVAAAGPQVPSNFPAIPVLLAGEPLYGGRHGLGHSSYPQGPSDAQAATHHACFSFPNRVVDASLAAIVTQPKSEPASPFERPEPWIPTRARSQWCGWRACAVQPLVSQGPRVAIERGESGGGCDDIA